jgi:hypothetical protein
MQPDLRSAFRQPLFNPFHFPATGAKRQVPQATFGHNPPLIPSDAGKMRQRGPEWDIVF